MKAARIVQPGPIEHLELGETPTPEPSPGQLLVRVNYAGVNPVDYKMLAGMFGPEFFPLTPGRDLAGTVAALGEGTEGFAIGDRVFGSALWGPAGTFAEEVITDPVHIVATPVGLSEELAAALPTAVITADQALFAHGELKEGERVLIAGASGGVGLMAIQLAKRAGATVVAVASSRNRDVAKEFGADEFVAYDEDPEYASAEPVDLALDLVGGETTARAGRKLKEGGRLVTAANFELTELTNGVKVRSFQAQPDAARLAEVGQLVADGEIEVPIEAEFPLENARDALERSATGRTVGKIVLRVTGTPKAALDEGGL